MTHVVVLDSDVVIDYLRDYAPAIAYIESLPAAPALPATVIGEVYAGVRDGAERLRLDGFVARSPTFPLDARTAVVGGLFRRQYLKSHNVGFNDAMIAATADLQRLTLVTLNRKHFPMLTAVVVPYTKP